MTTSVVCKIVVVGGVPTQAAHKYGLWRKCRRLRLKEGQHNTTTVAEMAQLREKFAAEITQTCPESWRKPPTARLVDVNVCFSRTFLFTTYVYGSTSIRQRLSRPGNFLVLMRACSGMTTMNQCFLSFFACQSLFSACSAHHSCVSAEKRNVSSKRWWFNLRDAVSVIMTEMVRSTLGRLLSVRLEKELVLTFGSFPVDIMLSTIAATCYNLQAPSNRSWTYCKTRNFRARLISVNLVNCAVTKISLYWRLFHTYFDRWQPQFTSIYEPGRIAIY